MTNKSGFFINNTSNTHIKAIDSLRGVASLSVFFFHFLALYLNESAILKPWFFIFAGHEAVILFFVLSGFILSWSHEKLVVPYWKYVIRRIFRIYPAYYVSMALSIILFLLIQPYPLSQYTQWFNTQFSTINLSPRVFFDVVFLVTNPASNINGVIWSLVYEVIISILILPFFWRIKSKKNIIILTVLYFIFFVQRQIIHPYNIIMDNSLYFSIFFYIGYLVCYFRDKLMILNQTKFIPVYIFCYASLYFSFGHGIFIKATVRDFLTGFGVVGFLSLVLYNQSIQNILNKKILNFYGKISYSFYLLHIPVIYGFVYTCDKFFHPAILLIMIFATTTLISTMLYYTVERKFIALAKILVAG